MKRIGCIGFIFIIGIIWAIVYFFGQVVNEVDTSLDSIEQKKENVGERVVIKNDTLLIMDYTIYNDNYLLEDGREISYEFGVKFLIN